MIHLCYDVPDVLVVLEGDLASGLHGKGLTVLRYFTIGSGGESGKGVIFACLKVHSKGLSTNSVVVDHGIYT